MVLSNAPSSPRLTHRPISLDSASGDELTSGGASGERHSQNDGKCLLPWQDRGYTRTEEGSHYKKMVVGNFGQGVSL